MELGGLRIHGHQTSLLVLEGKLEGAFRDRRQQQANTRTGVEARRRKPPERFAGLIGSDGFHHARGQRHFALAQRGGDAAEFGWTRDAVGAFAGA
jgi:hypothetical protein